MPKKTKRPKPKYRGSKGDTIEPRCKYTDKHREQFLGLMERNLGNISKTCRQLGIVGAHQTIGLWREKYPWFAEALNELKYRIFDTIEQNVFAAAADDSGLTTLDPAALTARKFLLTYHPEGRRRGYRRRDELTGEDGAPLSIRSFVELVEHAERE